jgi:hypothetical protein
MPEFPITSVRAAKAPMPRSSRSLLAMPQRRHSFSEGFFNTPHVAAGEFAVRAAINQITCSKHGFTVARFALELNVADLSYERSAV